MVTAIGVDTAENGPYNILAPEMYVSSDWTSLPPRGRPLSSHLFCTLRLYVLIVWYLLLAMGAVGHLLSRDSPLKHASHRRFSHWCVVDGEFRAYVWKGQSTFLKLPAFSLQFCYCVLLATSGLIFRSQFTSPFYPPVGRKGTMRVSSHKRWETWATI